MNVLSLISGPNILSYSRNDVIIKLGTVQNDSLVLLSVYDADNNELCVLQGRSDHLNEVSFNIASVLDTLVDFDEPDFSIDFASVSSPISKYHCIANEVDSWDLTLISTLNIGWDGTNASLYVVKGGVSFEKNDIDIFSYFLNNNRFLTWHNDAKIIKEQNYLLYYLSQFDEDIEVNIFINYDDGTTHTETVKTATVTSYTMYVVNAGYMFHNLEGINQGKTIVNYRVYINSVTDSVERASMLFFPKDSGYFYPVYIISNNSLGGLDFYHFTGVGKMVFKSEVKSNTVENDQQSIEKVYYAQFQKQVTVATGFLSHEELELLTEALISTKLYEVLGNNLIPIVIDKSTVSEYTTHSGVNGLSFKYVRAVKNRNYTPDGIQN